MDAANIITETQNVKPECESLTAQIQAAHQAICSAGRNMLREAFTAGAALFKLKKLIPRGESSHYLRRHCDLSERTARIYMQFAEHRDLIEAKVQHAADLSLRGALRLIGNKSPQTARSSPKVQKTALSTLSWSEASIDERRHFVDGIGLVSLLAAIPPTWHAEIERRVLGQRKAKAQANDKFNVTISKTLQQALSLQRAHKNKDEMAPGVAAALNTINNLLAKEGSDLNAIVGVLLDQQAVKAA